MDIATIIGVIAAATMLIGSIIIAGGALPGFIDLPAMLIIIGGGVCGILIAFPLKDVMRLPMLFKTIFCSTPRELEPIIEKMILLAEIARRDGLLALEAQIHDLDDSFLVSGIRMAIDGLSPETVESILRGEMKTIHARHNIGRKIVSQLGRTAPMFGLMTTLMGLVMMLASLDTSTIGRNMSIALLGTFYGTVLANLFFLPAAEKLSWYNSHELEIMEMITIGIVGIQHGENPLVIRKRLAMFLPQKQRMTTGE